MRTSTVKIAAFALTAATFAVPTFAQTTQSSPNGGPPAIASPNGKGSMDKQATSPSAVQPSPSARNSGDAMKSSTAMTPDVGMTGDKRASRLIGMDVVNDKDQTIGKVDDILIGADNKATAAVISVGGFLGIGAKLVAVPFDQLMPAANDRKSLTMPNASKESLTSMPAFNYGKGA